MGINISKTRSLGICKLGTWLRAMKQRGKLVPNGKIDLRGLYAEAETGRRNLADVCSVTSLEP